MSARPFEVFPVGTRVVFKHDTDRYDHFVVPKGTTATVVESTEYGVWVHVDQHVPGLSDSTDWQGDFMWTPEEWEHPAPFEVMP